MARFDLCGPTYQSQSLNADCERTVNLYPEIVEGSGKTQLALYPSPGLKVAYGLGSSASLGIFACQPAGSTTDRLFAVVQSGNNQTLYEMFEDGTKIARGAITAPTTSVVTIQHNGLQLLICSGGNLWLFDFGTNILAVVASPPADPIALIDYSDGFFFALAKNSSTVYMSGLLDGTSWPALSKAEISEFPDNVISMKVNQRIAYFQGRKGTVPYSNVGALNFPFVPIDGAFIENGAGAVQAGVKLDNSIFWIDLDERGGGVARKLSGYTPQRVSNHAVETIWQSYPKISDAIGYAYQDQGHSFWHIYFPSGTSPDGYATGASWRYDVESGMWHEVAYWNAVAARFEAHRSQNHAYAWGKHFVGDYADGKIYQMAVPSRSGNGWQFADDAGAPIRRIRRAPVVSNENEWMFHERLEIDLETGMGPQPPLTAQQLPTAITLQDANGNFWTVRVTDAGLLQSTPGSVQTQATRVVLNDPAQGASWQIGIDTFGNLTAAQVIFQGGYPTSFQMFSVSGTRVWQMMITLAGNIQTQGGGLIARGPQLMMRLSNDHGHTWSNYRQVDCGQAGAFKTRAIFRRLGRSRSRVYEISMSDPIPWRIVNAYLKASPGFQTQERAAKQLAKQA